MTLIYHIFADTGIESEILSEYGEVVRIGLNPTRNSYDNAVKADAYHVPIRKKADLVFLQPECKKWSPLGNGTGPNQISKAREIGQKYGKDYIIENVPNNDELRHDVRLYGSNFGLPVSYSRVFETSFELGDRPSFKDIDTTVSIRNSHFRSKEWWQNTKGYDTHRDRKDIVVKEGIPAAYVEWLLEEWVSNQ